MVAQAQTGSMLDGELTIRADFTRLHLQVAAQGVHQSFGPGEGAYGSATDTRDGSAHGLAREHGIEIDDAVYVGERHRQGPAHFCRNGFGKPAVELLRSLQGRQQRSAALRRQSGEHRAEANEIGIRHLV